MSWRDVDVDNDDDDDGDHLMIIIGSSSRLPAKISRCWSVRKLSLSWRDVDVDNDDYNDDDDADDADHCQRLLLQVALLAKISRCWSARNCSWRR